MGRNLYKHQLARAGGRGQDQATGSQRADCGEEWVGVQTDSWAQETRVHRSDQWGLKKWKKGSEGRNCKQKNLEAQRLPFPRLRGPTAGSPGLLSQEDSGFESTLSVLLTQVRIHPGLWTPQLLAPFTLKRGVRTTAPALPNSKAVSSWGSTLCRQKSSGNESRLLLSSWKNFCFSAGSLIWG